MYIREPEELARALMTILKDRVLVRYAVRGWGHVHYNAELIVLSTIGAEDFLYQAHFSLRIVRGTTGIESEFKVVGFRHEPQILESLARRWLRRSTDDWCHDEQFMGAYEINRDGQVYTSIELPPSDPRWHLLVGTILSELHTRQAAVDPDNVVEKHNIKLMSKRFSAFATENISAWADLTFSAH